MTTITHAKVSAISDGGDTSLVRPSDWNADHVISGTGALETAYAALASNQTGVSSDTATDVTGCTISLAAGTWLIWGQGVGGAGYNYFWLTTGSSGAGTPFAQAENDSDPAGRGTATIAPVIVTPGSTTSYHLRGQVGSGGTLTFYANPNTQGTATFIAAVRIDEGANGATGVSSCMVQRTTTQSTSSNPTAVQFNAADLYDPDGWHDPSTNNTRLTCPTGKGGRMFIVTCSIEHNPGSGFNGQFRKNGTTVVGAFNFGNYTVSVAAPVYLDDGDYVELLMGTASGDVIQTDAPTTFGIMSGGSGAGAVEALDEGGSLTATVASLDFVGAGVTATTSGDDVTVTIPGGAASWDVEIVKSGDEGVTNSNTLQDDNEFSFSIGSLELWQIEVVIGYTTDATGDIKTALAISTGAAQWNYRFMGQDASNSAFSSVGLNATTAVTGSMVGGGGSTAVIRGMFIEAFVRADNAGTIKFQFAQNTTTSGQTATVKAGSIFRARRIA